MKERFAKERFANLTRGRARVILKFRAVVLEGRMDEIRFERWRDLHLRFGRHDHMTPEELAEFEAGCQVLDCEEEPFLDIPRLREQRARIEELESQNARLRAKSRRLDSQIKRIEASLSDQTRQQLGVGI